MFHHDIDPMRVITTPTCSFKLYASVEEKRMTARLHALATAWICEPTAGFLLLDSSVPSFNAYWWENDLLFRSGVAFDKISAKTGRDPLAFASLQDLPFIGHEAASWARHVVQTKEPSLIAYLGDFLA